VLITQFAKCSSKSAYTRASVIVGGNLGHTQGIVLASMVATQVNIFNIVVPKLEPKRIGYLRAKIKKKKKKQRKT
jgi:hypothetical protein